MTTILLTGGAGSLGIELLKQFNVLADKPDIRVLDNNEHALSKITYTNVRKLYGDVSDKERVMKSMHGVDVVIHTAAMKNLEITEYNTSELIKTNIIGTDNVIQCAVDAGVKKVLFISSDKAVEPSSIYGASKLIGEHIALNYNNTQTNTKISILRSGNFLDSRGNVFEIWKEQKENNKLITITDRMCTRYFIETKVLASIILDILKWMCGGEIYIPDNTVLKEYTITDMLIHAGLHTIQSNEIKYTGLRKGEKLFEVLYSSTEQPKIIKANATRCLIIK